MTEKKARIVYLAGDWLFSTIAWVAFTYFRFESLHLVKDFNAFGGYFFSPNVMLGQVLVPLIWLTLFYYSGFYNTVFRKTLIAVFLLSFIPVFIGAFFIFFLLILNDQPELYKVYYEHIFVLFVFEFFSIYLFRLFFTKHIHARIKNGSIRFNTLVVGTGEQAIELKKYIERNEKKSGYHFSGFIERDVSESSTQIESGQVYAEKDLARIIRKKKIKVLVLGFEQSEIKGTLHQMYQYYKYGLPVKIPSDTYYAIFGHLTLQKIEDDFLIDIFENNFSEWQKNIKLTFDKLFSAAALLFFSPFMLYFAIKTKLDSKGKIIYRQERIGYKGKPFYIYKFRTMYEDSEKNGPALSHPSDQRITPFGIFLRKHRLDEIPQFWNVIKGDMSVVGPRPERAFYIHKIEKNVPYFHLVLNTRPGITSLSSVKFGYAKSVKEMVLRTQYDLIYYKNMSLYLDFRIIMLTIKTVFLGKGM